MTPRDEDPPRRLLEGRAALLDARLDIYSVNFGDASRHFEAAHGGACVRPMHG